MFLSQFYLSMFSTWWSIFYVYMIWLYMITSCIVIVSWYRSWQIISFFVIFNALFSCICLLHFSFYVYFYYINMYNLFHICITCYYLFSIINVSNYSKYSFVFYPFCLVLWYQNDFVNLFIVVIAYLLFMKMGKFLFK